MTFEIVRAVLGWGAILNLAFVTVWFLLFIYANEWIFELHRRWFQLSRQTFDAIHYAGMAWYKAATWIFFIMPYLALRLVMSTQ